ncbi:hypothetical protein [Actinomycetospora sp. TBRC 11914]|uniref:hypothetical protein n=1 Tax=Actinomycetospora sp. TBRC 11914 TaxID=2729387 RepID=UPI001B7D4ED1|nr:hypothetical protein [Actinomycetospora sp. TBRC 11914]
MSAAAGTAVRMDDGHAVLADRLVAWLETGGRPGDLFTDDVFVDLSLPQWRVQGQGADTAFGIREDGHPHRGRVRVEALDRTSRGFLLQFEERWSAGAQQWYCRELIHGVVRDGRIAELSIYCTGDWDEAVQRRHAGDVSLLRP